MRVLIVDDAKFMRALVGDVLRSGGIEVVGEAGNGAEALVMYKRLHPDVVTMDITMPEVSGIEGVKLLKEYDPNAKVIMISAMGQTHLITEAIQSGAVNFIVKPFKREVLLDAVNRLG